MFIYMLLARKVNQKRKLIQIIIYGDLFGDMQKKWIWLSFRFAFFSRPAAANGELIDQAVSAAVVVSVFLFASFSLTLLVVYLSRARRNIA